MLQLFELVLPMSNSKPDVDALALTNVDNVATVLRAVLAGEVLGVRRGGDVTTLAARSDIPICHKIALEVIAPGQPVTKYGEVIGIATAVIERGRHVHVHNMRSNRARS